MSALADGLHRLANLCRKELLAVLMAEPLFQIKGELGRLAHGTLRTELADLGIVT